MAILGLHCVSGGEGARPGNILMSAGWAAPAPGGGFVLIRCLLDGPWFGGAGVSRPDYFKICLQQLLMSTDFCCWLKFWWLGSALSWTDCVWCSQLRRAFPQLVSQLDNLSHLYYEFCIEQKSRQERNVVRLHFPWLQDLSVQKFLPCANGKMFLLLTKTLFNPIWTTRTPHIFYPKQVNKSNSFLGVEVLIGPWYNTYYTWQFGYHMLIIINRLLPYS